VPFIGHVKMVRQLALVLSAAVFFSSVAQGQGTVLHATVADAETGNYILDAEVTVDPVGLKSITDYFGDARFRGLGKGSYSVHARRIGFEPVSTNIQASGRDSLRITLLLTPITHELAAVTVDAVPPSGFLREFEQRRRLGKGQYITDSVLRTSLGIPLGDILRARIRGVTVIGGSNGSFIPISARGSNSLSGPCRINVYWNGVRITRSGSSSVDIPTDFVGGVEFYNPGSMPVEYQDPGNDCGVLLLWSRP
jgi:hypothetical protein